MIATPLSTAPRPARPAAQATGRQGTHTDPDLPHAVSDVEDLIPQQRQSGLQPLFAWTDDLIEALGALVGQQLAQRR